MKIPVTFASLIKEFEFSYPLRTVFEDFLTMTICAFSHDPHTGVSDDEELYLKTIHRYKDDPLRYNFPKMLAALTYETEARQRSNGSSDVLGEFYERHLYVKNSSQYFTSWLLAKLLAEIALYDAASRKRDGRLRIYDPACGSGRTLLIASRIVGMGHECYGVDVDHTCVKMAAINLFLHGVFYSEVLLADSLTREDFRGGYKISFLPFGVFRIREKKDSKLWQMHQG